MENDNVKFKNDFVILICHFDFCLPAEALAQAGYLHFEL